MSQVNKVHFNTLKENSQPLAFSKPAVIANKPLPEMQAIEMVYHAVMPRHLPLASVGSSSGQSQAWGVDVFQASPVAIALVTTTDLRLVEVNERFQQLTGYDREELIGQTVQQLELDAYSFPSEQNPVAARLKTQSWVENVDYKIRTKSGEVRDVLLSVKRKTLREEVFICCMTDVSQRRQLEAERWQQVERERVVAAIAQRTHPTVDLHTLFSASISEIGASLLADYTAIAQYSMQQWTPLAVHRCSGVGLEGEKLLADPQILTKLTQLKSAQLNEDSGYSHRLTLTQMKSLLAIPIVVDHSHWGALVLLRRDAWMAIEVEQAQAIAGQLANAIQQCQLFQQVQQFNTELKKQVHDSTAKLRQSLQYEAALKRITDKVRDSLDEQQILQVAVEELALLLKLDGCNAGIYNLHERTCRIACSYANQPVLPQGSVIRLADYAEIYECLLAHQPTQFCMLSQRSHPKRHRRAVLACPVFDSHNLLGDLWLFRPSSEGYDEQEVRLVSQVANQCAIALRQARLYKESQAQVAALENLNNLKDDFLSTISHELRTPVSNIKMATQMLTLALSREGLLASDTGKPQIAANKIAHYLGILRDECNREIRLITDLLDLQRLETGAEAQVIQTIQLEPYLQRILQPFWEQTQAHNQRLEVNLPEHLPDLRSDAQSLERILTELLTNACKYTPSHERIRLTVSINPAIGTKPSELVLRVCNTGTELSQVQLQQIFDKFYRLPNSDPHRYSGTGLGLALVKRLVNSLGGTIQADSAAMQVQFVLTLPLAMPR